MVRVKGIMNFLLETSGYSCISNYLPYLRLLSMIMYVNLLQQMENILLHIALTAEVLVPCGT